MAVIEPIPETTTSANLMDVAEAIRTRRTIRSWENREVPKELIHELLEAALWAPSACNMQLWDFVVVTDPIVRRDLAAAVPFADHAPVLIFVCYNTRFSEGSYANIQSASAAVMNMLLRAHALGLGGFWQATIHNRPHLRQILGLPQDVEVLSTTLFGWPAERPSAPQRRDPTAMLHWERYRPKPPVPTAQDPAAWTLQQIADYQHQRIRAGPKYNKPIRSEFEEVSRFVAAAILDSKPRVWVDLLPCTGIYLERLLATLPQMETQFVELSQQVADFVRRRLPRPAAFHVWDGGRLEWTDETVDVATCLFRLESLPPATGVHVLREVHRILRPRGRLVLAYVNRLSYFQLMRLLRGLFSERKRNVEYALAPDPSLGPFLPLGRGDVRRMAYAAGLRRVSATHLFPLPSEEEATFRVRNLPRPLKSLQIPLRVLYRATEPLHAALGPLAKIQLEVYVRS